MNDKEIMKQIIDFQTESLKNCFTMMITLQMQAENIFNFFHYLPIMSEDGKAFMRQRTAAYKKWVDDLKKIMEEGYLRLEAFCDSNTLTIFREHTQKMYELYLAQADCIPGDIKKSMEDLDAIYKKGCEEFRKYVDDYMRSLKNIYTATSTSPTKTKQRK